MSDIHFQRFVSKLIRRGSIEIEEPGGRRYFLGDGTGTPPLIKFCDDRVKGTLLRDPELTFGELFMDGRILVLRGTLYDVLAIVMSNLEQAGSSRWIAVLRRIRHAVQRWHYNTLRRSRANVAHHYDLGNALYALFLDDDWQYSCAYFETMEEDLNTAQLAKKQHIAAKLLLEPGNRVLEIGCGWGGLALYLAQSCDVHITGITLSREQLDLACRRRAAGGLESRLEFRFQDYRQVAERYDRIVSIAMLEAVGPNGYEGFFRKVCAMLNDDGVALVHTITSANADFNVGPWTHKYIFPGSHIPSLSQLMPAIERAGLIVTDVEVLRLHYARTLMLWRDRFLANRDRAKALFDERFCRMWEFYLSVAQCMFEFQNCSVSQIQMTKRISTLPLTRDYMMEKANGTSNQFLGAEVQPLCSSPLPPPAGGG